MEAQEQGCGSDAQALAELVVHFDTGGTHMVFDTGAFDTRIDKDPLWKNTACFFK
jgi:hypothetical protein